jgi:hypothetical protein
MDDLDDSTLYGVGDGLPYGVGDGLPYGVGGGFPYGVGDRLPHGVGDRLPHEIPEFAAQAVLPPMPPRPRSNRRRRAGRPIDFDNLPPHERGTDATILMANQQSSGWPRVLLSTDWNHNAIAAVVAESSGCTSKFVFPSPFYRFLWLLVVPETQGAFTPRFSRYPESGEK